jgi:hypothetical protein
MTQLMTNLPSGSPEFKKLLTAGLVCVGAKVEYATLMGGIGEPEDIANAIAFLALTAYIDLVPTRRCTRLIRRTLPENL